MTVFLTADTHFSHLGVCQFLAPDGVNKMRPWETTEEMDEALVENWNKVVKQKDKVYHLGDVAINRKGLQVLERLNGDKVLIKGNHDIFKVQDYLKYFRDIRACDKKDDYILSHVPVHPDIFDTRFKGNIHGHLHDYCVTKTMGVNNNVKVPDLRYVCVSVEQTDFTPIAWEEVIKRFN